MNLINFCFLITFVKAWEFSDEEYAVLPRLFELDDYHDCMAQNDGIYCLGTFHLTPMKKKDPVYSLMEALLKVKTNCTFQKCYFQCRRTCKKIHGNSFKSNKKYSKNKFTFNRTLIHRGHCLSLNCPYTTTNATSRFERCVEKWANTKGFHANLHKLEYCRNSQKLRQYPDVSQVIFMYAVVVIILLNIIGTICDVTNRKKEGVTKFLTLWSIHSNWKRFTTIIYEHKDPRLKVLAPMSGARVLICTLVMLAHSKYIHYMSYIQNPRVIEKEFAGYTGVIFMNGSTIVQIFVLFSSFLCSYNLLLSSKKIPLLFSSMPKHILKRVFRLTPVHMFIVGFGATWYSNTRDGPIWPALVGKEEDACRNKFWAHLLFINNYIEPDKKCYLQTWFLAADMQMYITTLFLTTFLANYGRATLKILVFLFISSLILVSGVAYLYGWESMLYISTPELVHAYFNFPSVERMYTTPLGCISSSIVGIIIAHLQYSIQETDVKVYKWKWLVHTHYLFIPLFVAWILSGVYIRDIFTSAFAVAAYIGFERLVFNVFIAIINFGTMNIDSPLRRFLTWHGWDVFARFSLPVLMIHWPVNMAIAASRPGLLYSTFFDLIADFSATWIITYILAVPVSILLEMPMQRIPDYFYN